MGARLILAHWGSRIGVPSTGSRAAAAMSSSTSPASSTPPSRGVRARAFLRRPVLAHARRRGSAGDGEKRVDADRARSRTPRATDRLRSDRWSGPFEPRLVAPRHPESSAITSIRGRAGRGMDGMDAHTQTAEARRRCRGSSSRLWRALLRVGDDSSGATVPWCITLDNSKGISRLRFWAKNSRVNGINDLPVFMHQGTSQPEATCQKRRLENILDTRFSHHFGGVSRQH